MADKAKHVLFLCTGNSARSQMAEALLRKHGGDQFVVCSAGTHPKGMHPMTIEVMKEIGIDVSGQTSKDVAQFANRSFDSVITVCDNAKQQCPVFPGIVPIHWSFEDPAEAKGDPEAQLRKFRKVRDEISRRIRLWLLATQSAL